MSFPSFHSSLYIQVPETNGDPSLPMHMRQHCAAVHNACFQYSDMTVEVDVQKVTEQADCIYKAYEKRRIEHLKKKLMYAISFKRPWYVLLFFFMVLHKISNVKDFCRDFLTKTMFVGGICDVILYHANAPISLVPSCELFDIFCINLCVVSLYM